MKGETNRTLVQRLCFHGSSAAVAVAIVFWLTSNTAETARATLSLNVDSIRARVPEPTPQPDPVPSPTLPEPGRRDAKAVVAGAVLCRSALTGVPDRPFTEGVVAAVPIELMEAFGETLENPYTQILFERRRFAMPWTLHNDPEVVTCDIDDDARYSLTLTPGRYALCLANLDDARPPDPAANALWVEHWVEVEATGGRQVVIPIYNAHYRKASVSHDAALLGDPEEPEAGDGPTRVTGLVTGLGDNRGRPKVLTKGVVIAVPHPDLPVADVLTKGDCRDIGATWSAVTTGGRFELELAPGDYLLCVANFTPRKDELESFHVEGRTQITVERVAVQTVDLSHDWKQGYTAAHVR